MLNIFIEDSSLINKEEVSKILLRIPFYKKTISTTKKFPLYGHVLCRRPIEDDNFTENTKPIIDSEYYEYFKSYVDLFCSQNNISYKNVIRACINSTFHIPNYICGDPHVDFSRPHIVLLMYLSEISLESKTLIFDIRQENNGYIGVVDIDELETLPTIKKSIDPKFGKIVAFDGMYYHTNMQPLPGENRIVCVFNLLT